MWAAVTVPVAAITARVPVATTTPLTAIAMPVATTTPFVAIAVPVATTTPFAAIAVPFAPEAAAAAFIAMRTLGEVRGAVGGWCLRGYVAWEDNVSLICDAGGRNRSEQERGSQDHRTCNAICQSSHGSHALSTAIHLDRPRLPSFKPAMDLITARPASR